MQQASEPGNTNAMAEDVVAAARTIMRSNKVLVSDSASVESKTKATADLDRATCDLLVNGKGTLRLTPDLEIRRDVTTSTK